jgi:WD40 repeat protein
MSTLQGHSSSIGAMAWSPDGTQLASSSTDCSIKSGIQLSDNAHQPYGDTMIIFVPLCGCKTGWR